jgi:arylsulfatase A-like enzyme
MRSRTHRRIQSASPLYLLQLGLVTGGIAGLLETALLGPSRGTNFSPSAVVNTAVFYAVIWGVTGLVVGLVGMALRQRFSRIDRPSLGALVISLATLSLAGSYVNMTYLPSMFAPISFVVDLLILVGAVLLWFVIRAVWRRLSGRHPDARPGRTPLAVVTLVLAAVLVGIAVGPTPETDSVSLDVGDHTAGRNVLFLVVDALRADHLGCYGYDRATSANLDALADGGVLFLNAYAQGSRTKEATASMVTSLYASTHGVCDFSSVLPSSAPTMMEIAKSAGFRTAVLSANSLVSPTFGFGRGVDYFYCDVPSAVGKTLLMGTARNLGIRLRPMRWLPAALRSLDVLLPMPDKHYPYEGGDANVMNDAFLSWLDQVPGRDFFAYLHYMEPHAPCDPPPPYDTMYDPDYTGEPMTSVPIFPGSMLPFDKGRPMPDDQRRNLIAHYDGAITYFDEALGRLLEELNERGLTSRTLVVVVADHGEEFFDHEGWGHGHSVYDELIHVPLIMSMPGTLPGGTRAWTTARQIDLLPTMLSASGVKKGTESMDGVSLWESLLSGRDDWPEPPVMAEVFYGRQFSRAFKDGSNKLIHAKGGEGERLMLFNLSSDPGETEDVAAEKPDLTESLYRRLKGLLSEATSRRLEAGTTTIDEGTREKLRALGYVR